LAGLFETLRPPMPPIVVVQHMPPNFTKALAWRLDSLAGLTIKEAANGDTLRPNHVLIAPGGKHLEVRRRGSSPCATLPALSRERSSASGWPSPPPDSPAAGTFAKD